MNTCEDIARIKTKSLKKNYKGYTSLDSDKIKVFLDAIALGRSGTYAARMAGVNLQTAYTERDRNPKFAEAWKLAYESGTHHFEDIAAARAETKSDTMLIVTLKARDPNKYIERRALDITNNVNITVTKAREELANVPKNQLLESLALLEAPTLEHQSPEDAKASD